MKYASASAARKRTCGHARERAPGWFASRQQSELVMPHANIEAMGHHLQAVSACGTPCRVGAGPRGMAYHAQTAAVPERFIVVAARGLTRTQPGRAGMAATARSALGQSLLRRI